ncbi:MAG: alpha/beta fold hydrolase [Planctomycetaceae bacterium]|nr:alpha/beta fold hydrolase [Planctomycetaceae bacterium]
MISRYRWIMIVLLLTQLVSPLSAQQVPAPTIDLLASDGDLPAVKSPQDWEHRKTHILEQMQKVMGPLPSPETPVPLSMEILERRQFPSANRWKIRYHTDDPQAWVHAWLFLPRKVKQPCPAVLCLHQTTRIGKDEPAGLGGKENLHYASELAERGFVTLAPDYPSFGDSLDYDFEQDDYLSGTMKAIYDNVRAVDLLQSLPMVDADQIGCIGHSLGGHNTMFTAAFEPRIKAMVSCCGFTRFHKYYGGQLKGWTSSRYMPRIASVYNNDPDQVPFDFPEIVGTFAPRPFLAVAPEHDSNFEVSGVRDSISAAKPVYELLGASENLRAIYPDCAHDFPPEARETAYQFLEKSLGKN